MDCWWRPRGHVASGHLLCLTAAACPLQRNIFRLPRNPCCPQRSPGRPSVFPIQTACDGGLRPPARCPLPCGHRLPSLRHQKLAERQAAPSARHGRGRQRRRPTPAMNTTLPSRRCAAPIEALPFPSKRTQHGPVPSSACADPHSFAVSSQLRAGDAHALPACPPARLKGLPRSYAPAIGRMRPLPRRCKCLASEKRNGSCIIGCFVHKPAHPLAVEGSAVPPYRCSAHATGARSLCLAIPCLPGSFGGWSR